MECASQTLSTMSHFANSIRAVMGITAAAGNDEETRQSSSEIRNFSDHIMPCLTLGTDSIFVYKNGKFMGSTFTTYTTYWNYTKDN